MANMTMTEVERELAFVQAAKETICIEIEKLEEHLAAQRSALADLNRRQVEAMGQKLQIMTQKS